MKKVILGLLILSTLSFSNEEVKVKCGERLPHHHTLYKMDSKTDANTMMTVKISSSRGGEVIKSFDNGDNEFYIYRNNNSGGVYRIITKDNKEVEVSDWFIPSDCEYYGEYFKEMGLR